MTLPEIMQRYYDAEQNIEISSFWDGGWDVYIGDKANGFKDQTNCETLKDVVEWLVEKFEELRLG